MIDTDTSQANLKNLNSALAHWRNTRPDNSREEYKIHELLGALSCYVSKKDWDQSLNTTFGFIKGANHVNQL